MKRTNTILFSLATLLLAVGIAAGPAAAAQTGFRGLNGNGEPPAVSQPAQAAHVATADYQSVNSIVGSDAVPAETVSVVQADSGFSWGDAFIGAGAALVVLLISAMTVYELRRHRRLTVASGT
jgi:hypothetical protein